MDWISEKRVKQKVYKRCLGVSGALQNKGEIPLGENVTLGQTFLNCTLIQVWLSSFESCKVECETLM